MGLGFRWRQCRARSASVAGMVALVVCAGCGGSDETPRSSGTTDTAATPAPTTATVAPSTTTVADAISEAISVELSYLEGTESSDRSYVSANWVTTNLSDKTITSHQVRFQVRATDALGREFAEVAYADCLDHPIAPGETVRSDVRRVPLDLDMMDPSHRLLLHERGFEATEADKLCVYHDWGVNRFDDQQVGIHEALLEGATPDVVVDVTRVSFEDGSSLGEAVDN